MRCQGGSAARPHPCAPCPRPLLAWSLTHAGSLRRAVQSCCAATTALDSAPSPMSTDSMGELVLASTQGLLRLSGLGATSTCGRMRALSEREQLVWRGAEAAAARHPATRLDTAVQTWSPAHIVFGQPVAALLGGDAAGLGGVVARAVCVGAWARMGAHGGVLGPARGRSRERRPAHTCGCLHAHMRGPAGEPAPPGVALVHLPARTLAPHRRVAGKDLGQMGLGSTHRSCVRAACVHAAMHTQSASASHAAACVPTPC